MAPTAVKRRNVEDEVRRPKKKIRKFKKQKEYHSSSEDDEDVPTEEKSRRPQVKRRKNASDKPQVIPAAVPKDSLALHTESQPSIAALSESTTRAPQDSSVSEEEDEEDNDQDEEMGEVQINTALNMSAHDDSEEEEADDLDSDDGVAVNGLDEMEDDEEEDDLVDEFDSDNASEAAGTTRKKRNDPTAFATSISKILTTKLTTQKRNDPILSRSKTADEANKALADGKLETKARAAIRAEKRSLLERGRVKDVLGLDTPGVDTGAIMELEKRLKKTAQRGVVKLFNAVRAAQVKAEEAERTAQEAGMVGMHKREERINEMSKEGFLDLISRGGKTAVET